MEKLPGPNQFAVYHKITQRRKDLGKDTRWLARDEGKSALANIDRR